jgi:hypothetical protein
LSHQSSSQPYPSGIVGPLGRQKSDTSFDKERPFVAVKRAHEQTRKFKEIQVSALCFFVVSSTWIAPVREFILFPPLMIMVFWDLIPWSLVDYTSDCQRICCLYVQSFFVVAAGFSKTLPATDRSTQCHSSRP